MLQIDFSDTFLLSLAIVSAVALVVANKVPKIKKPIVLSVSLSYLVIILLLTLQPLFISSHHITIDEMRLYGLPWNIKPFSLIIPQWKNLIAGQRGAFRQFFGNIIMFIPAGILMPFVFRKTQKFWWALLGAFLFTFMIESLQFVLSIAGMCIRELDVDDLILNTLGALIGHGIYKLIFHGRENRAAL